MIRPFCFFRHECVFKFSKQDISIFRITWTQFMISPFSVRIFDNSNRVKLNKTDILCSRGLRSIPPEDHHPMICCLSDNMLIVFSDMILPVKMCLAVPSDLFWSKHYLHTSRKGPFWLTKLSTFSAVLEKEHFQAFPNQLAPWWWHRKIWSRRLSGAPPKKIIAFSLRAAESVEAL